MTSLPSRRRLTRGAAEQGATLRMGQVYLDVHRRRLAFLNSTARQLHNDGVPFTPEDLERRPLRTLDGRPVVAPELPLIIAWRENRPAEASFLLPRPTGPAWRVLWSTAPVHDGNDEVIGVLGSVACSPPEPDWQAMAGLAHD